MGTVKRGNAPAIFALLATAVLWSMGGLLIKTIEWNAFGIAGGRSLIALAVFLPFIRRIRFRFTLPAVAGAICYSMTTILFAMANKMTTAANAILLQYTAPIYVIILSAIFLKERARKLDYAAVAGVFAGLVLFLYEGISGSHLAGDLIAILSGVTFAGLAVFMRMQKDADPMVSVIAGNVLNAVVCIPVGLAVSKPAGGMIWLVVLGLFQLGLSYVLYSLAIKRVKALQAVLIAAVEPILNPIWVFLATGERPGGLALLGGLIVMASVLAHSWLRQRQDRRELERIESAEAAAAEADARLRSEALLPEGEHAH